MGSYRGKVTLEARVSPEGPFINGLPARIALAYDMPQVPQLVELQDPHDDPCELVNSPPLLWEQAERSFLMLLPWHVGHDMSWSPTTSTSKSLSHSIQWYSNIGIVELPHVLNIT